MSEVTECKAGFIHHVEHLRSLDVIEALGASYDSATVEIVGGKKYAMLSREEVPNLMPIEGINYMIGASMTGVAQLSAWYIAPFSGNYTPTSAITAATFPATATEAIAYNETTRQAWTPGAISAGGVTNSAAPATFTMNATLTLYGCAISSVPTKSAVSGTLISCALFAAPKAVVATDLVRVTSPFSMTSV